MNWLKREKRRYSNALLDVIRYGSLFHRLWSHDRRRDRNATIIIIIIIIITTFSEALQSIV